MGMDVDCIVGKQVINELENLLMSMGHGNRGEIADEIIDFVEKLKLKYKKDV